MQLLTVCDGLLLMNRCGEDEARGHAGFPLWLLMAGIAYGPFLHLLLLSLDLGCDSIN